MSHWSLDQIIGILTALVTLLSLIFNLYFSYKNRIESDENFKIMKKQFEQQDEDRLKEQSNKVGTWIDGISKHEENMSEYYLYSDTKVSNQSNLPIYNVFVFSMSNNGSGNFEEISQTFYSNGNYLRHYYVWTQIIPTGISTIQLPTQGSAMGGQHPAASILFTDQNGHGWYRNTMGQLSQHDNYILQLLEWGLPNPDYKM